jgi:hypothetical protein
VPTSFASAFFNRIGPEAKWENFRFAGRAAQQIRVDRQSQDPKAIGVELPTSILLRADSVIE